MLNDPAAPVMREPPTFLPIDDAVQRLEDILCAISRCNRLVWRRDVPLSPSDVTVTADFMICTQCRHIAILIDPACSASLHNMKSVCCTIQNTNIILSCDVIILLNPDDICTPDFPHQLHHWLFQN